MGTINRMTRRRFEKSSRTSVELPQRFPPLKTSFRTTVSETIPITVTRVFREGCEAVYDAWLNPAVARQFFFATDSGEMVKAEIDARVGGRFLMVDRRGGEDVPHGGRFEALDRPNRIVFTFAVPPDTGDETRVELLFDAIESGCRLTLNHGLHPDWAAYEAQTREGWRRMLEKLEQVFRQSGTG